MAGLNALQTELAGLLGHKALEGLSGLVLKDLGGHYISMLVKAGTQTALANEIQFGGRIALVEQGGFSLQLDLR